MRVCMSNKNCSLQQRKWHFTYHWTKWICNRQNHDDTISKRCCDQPHGLHNGLHTLRRLQWSKKVFVFDFKEYCIRLKYSYLTHPFKGVFVKAVFALRHSLVAHFDFLRNNRYLFMNIIFFLKVHWYFENIMQDICMISVRIPSEFHDFANNIKDTVQHRVYNAYHVFCLSWLPHLCLIRIRVKIWSSYLKSYTVALRDIWFINPVGKAKLPLRFIS